MARIAVTAALATAALALGAVVFGFVVLVESIAAEHRE